MKVKGFNIFVLLTFTMSVHLKAQDLVLFKGYFVLDNQIYCSIYDLESGVQRWLKKGQWAGTYELLEFAPSMVEAILFDHTNEKIVKVKLNESSDLPSTILLSKRPNAQNNELSEYNKRLHSSIERIIPIVDVDKNTSNKESINLLRASFSTLLLSGASRQKINSFIDQNVSKIDIEVLMKIQGDNTNVESRNRRNTPGWEALTFEGWVRRN